MVSLPYDFISYGLIPLAMSHIPIANSNNPFGMNRANMIPPGLKNSIGVLFQHTTLKNTLYQE
jgi:hypothetical protein